MTTTICYDIEKLLIEQGISLSMAAKAYGLDPRTLERQEIKNRLGKNETDIINRTISYFGCDPSTLSPSQLEQLIFQSYGLNQS
ncbi:MAG: hypothetical protein ACOYT4_03180 [Nanoarchaeota archaeon]